MDPTESLRREILAQYASSVGLPAAPSYISGAPLRPVVPLDTGSDVFILGAYPSARFGVIKGVRDVPVADNLGPFEPERYHDGERVRVQASAAELEENYLSPLGVRRDRCWVTDLVKVFLFKEGHRNKYEQLGGIVPTGYVREAFEDLGARSLPWIGKELELARPRLVITLGREVAGIVTGTNGDAARTRLLGGEVVRKKIGSVEVDVAYLPHPGIVMRAGDDGGKNPWPRRNAEYVAKLSAWLKASG